MSQPYYPPPPNNYPVPQKFNYPPPDMQPQQSNVLGIIGLIAGASGFLSCGLSGMTCGIIPPAFLVFGPLGLTLSIIGLRHPQKNLAVAGTVLSVIPTIFTFVAIGLLIAAPVRPPLARNENGEFVMDFDEEDEQALTTQKVIPSTAPPANTPSPSSATPSPNLAPNAPPNFTPGVPPNFAPNAPPSFTPGGPPFASPSPMGMEDPVKQFEEQLKKSDRKLEEATEKMRKQMADDLRGSSDVAPSRMTEKDHKELQKKFEELKKKSEAAFQEKQKKQEEERQEAMKKMKAEADEVRRQAEEQRQKTEKDWQNTLERIRVNEIQQLEKQLKSSKKTQAETLKGMKAANQGNSNPASNEARKTLTEQYRKQNKDLEDRIKQLRKQSSDHKRLASAASPSDPEPSNEATNGEAEAEAESPSSATDDQAFIDAGHKRRPRKWTAVSGKTIEASFVSATGTQVKLRRVDNQKEVLVPRDKLSEADEEYIANKKYEADVIE